jgi:hypothetical protein
MSEPAQTPKPQDTKPEAERDPNAKPAQARPSDDGGPHAGASLDLPMSSPD